MKKSKIISVIVAALLSAVMLIGCSGGATAVGKKYDAIYAAVDDYVIALDGTETYLYKNDKKVGKNGYYSIELFSSTYTDRFKARKNFGDETVILLGNDGSAKTLPEEITELAQVYTDTVYDDNGITYTVKTVGFSGIRKDDGKGGGKYALVTPDGTIAARADSVKYIGGGVFVLTHSATDDGEAQVSVVNASGAELVPSAPISEIQIDTVNPNTSGSSTRLNTVNGVNVFTVTKDGETSVYGANGLIEKDAEVFAGSKNRVYKKGDDFYALDASLSKVKLGYKIDEYLTYYDGKHYVSESNGNSGADERFRVREVFGEAGEYWFEFIRKCATTTSPCFIGTEADDTDHVPRSVVYNGKMESTLISNKIANIGNSTANVRYVQYSKGYAGIVNTATGLEAEVSGGENGTYSPANGSTVILNNNIYAVIKKDGAARLWTAAMSEPIDLDPEKSDDLNITKTLYKINGLPVMAEDVKFFDGTASSPAVVDSKFAQIENYTVDTRYGLNVVARREKYDLLDKDARVRMSDGVLQVKLAVFTWEDGGAEKSETYLLYRKNGSGEIYTKVRIGDGKATLGSVNASGVVLVSKDDGKEFYKAILSENGEASLVLIGSFGKNSRAERDALGNIYILDEVNGKTAVYSENGELLLKPVYNVEEVANGIAIVYNGSETKYYGAVKLGKTANKAKLIKKIEYESHKLYSSGDFTLGKAGSDFTLYNADGKKVISSLTGENRVCALSSAYGVSKLYVAKAGDRERVSKTIVTSTDGKECVITRSAKEKNLGWSVTNVLFVE